MSVARSDLLKDPVVPAANKGPPLGRGQDTYELVIEPGRATTWDLSWHSRAHHVVGVAGLKGTAMRLVSICIPIYNNVRNVKSLVDSIRATSPLHDFEILIYNDGSNIPGLDEEANTFCVVNGLRYLSSAVNRGVPHAWNTLCQASASDIIVLLNDDLRCSSDDWIQRILFLFSKNDRLGICYWCQRIVDPATGVPLRLTTDSVRVLATKPRLPVLRHNFCGAFFAFRKSIWERIEQPDDSTGFWGDLLSYGEEFDFSAEVLNRGYFILQLPIVWDHLHSQTFNGNPKKRLRTKLSPFLDADEFQRFLQPNPQPHRLFSVRSALRRFERAKRFSSEPISALDYSMAMLEKKWRNRTILGIEGVQFLTRMRSNGFPTALRSAVEAGAFIPPETITVYEDHSKKDRGLPWDKLMDETAESLL